jgi:hypothetical protein
MGQMFYGVRLFRRQSEIMNVIDRFTRMGSAVPTVYLAELFYSDKAPETGMNTVRVVINQINDRLAETDYRIRNDKVSGYRIVRGKGLRPVGRVAKS